MSLSPGQRLGPYEILSPLGAGGMGEVYKAVDSRLERYVAIKVLPADLASDPERLRRFEHEARTASSLNHPNIVTVYDVGSFESISYIATEFVDGRTLLEILLSGPLGLKKLLELARQIAEGLASAHEAGIIHRDLKPGNLMVSKDGFVKLLDFGLARRDVQSPLRASDTATAATAPATLPGTVLGTVGYMSPEQARGDPIDYRSDQFSFGSVLYEMSTGVRAFGRGSTIETLSAILRDEPEAISKLRPELPAPMRWLIERCLAKSPSDRYSSTRDLARELKGIEEHLSELSGEQRTGGHLARRRGRRVLIGTASGLAILAIGAFLGLSGLLRKASTPEFRRLTFRSGLVSRALFTPRSNSILYTATWDGQLPGSFLTLPDSPGLDLRLDSQAQLPMAYAADGSQVLVLLGASRATIDLRGALAWWPAHGGRARPILENGGWADWAPKGNFFVVVRDTGDERVLEVRAESGLERPLFRTRGAISRVRLSPDEGSVAFIHHPARYDDAGEVRLASTDGSASKPLSPRYERCLGLDWNVKTGEIWFTASPGSPYTSTIFAVRPSGRPRALYSLPDLFVLQNVSPSGTGCLLVSSENRISLTVRRAGEPPRDLSWLGMTMVADLSPDGKTVLFADGGPKIWIRSLDGSDAVYLGPGDPGGFSPDGKSIVALTSALAGPPQLQIVPIGAGATRQLTSSSSNHWSPSFAGPSTVLFASSEGGANQIWRIQADGTGARPLGAAGCEQPRANPSLTEFLCICGEGKDRLSIYPLMEGPGRDLRRLSGGGRFHYVRWSSAGDRIFAVTSERRFLTINSATGELLKEEVLPLPGGGLSGAFYRAAFSGDGDVQAYSAARSSSGLYYCTGLE